MKTQNDKKIKALNKKIDALKLDMVSLYKKGKDKDTISLIKKKNEKLNKLNEELEKMTKFKIKDGKLQPVDDNEEAPKPTKEELEEKRKVREVEMEAIERKEAEAMFKKRKPVKAKIIEEEMEQEEVAEPEITEEDIRRYQEEQMIKERMLRERAEQEEMARAEAMASQSREVPQAAPQQPNLHKVRVILFPNTPTTIDIPGEDFELFIDNINKAIDNQSTMYLGGSAVVNGRYIIRYDVL